MGWNPPRRSLASEHLEKAPGWPAFRTARSQAPGAGPEASPRPLAGLGGALHPQTQAAPLQGLAPVPQSLGQVSAVPGQGHTARLLSHDLQCPCFPGEASGGGANVS